VQPGYAWADTLRAEAQRLPPGRPWWQARDLQPLLARYAPHLPELYRGMAHGADLPDDRVGERYPLPDQGCTSFAVAPAATLAGQPFSGQTKDTHLNRALRFQVLSLRLTDHPASALTLTYPGWLFGHGFVAGGCAIFRNSLYAGATAGGRIPYFVWGLLALHCPTVAAVAELSRQFPPIEQSHAAVADEQGGILGCEFGQGGLGLLEPEQGLYVHANAVVAPALLPHEQEEGLFRRADSLHRVARCRALLSPDLGRLTPQLAWRALADHDGYPVSICRHQAHEAQTTAAVVVEPVARRLTVCRGAPCRQWPVTYTL
jgi:isopenicillin-N N-acyltransferase-like protein